MPFSFILSASFSAAVAAVLFQVLPVPVGSPSVNRITFFDFPSDNKVSNCIRRKCQVFLQHFFKKIFNIVYLLFIIYNDIIRLQLQLFLSSFLKKCIEKRLSSGSHFLYAPLSFILLIFPFH